MSRLPAPVLDHVVVNVKHQLDDAAAVYRQLGFALTERGHHSLGSSNHLAIFGENYLELLGFETGKTASRPDIVDAPPGLSGLVFKTDDSLALHEAIGARGLAVEPPAEFFRPVKLPGGAQDARFRTVRLGAELVRNGRTFFCHHFTPELVWRDEDRQHPNGVTEIVGFVVASPEPQTVADLYERLFGPGVIDTVGAAHYRLRAGRANVEFVTPAEAERRYGAVASTNDGSERYVALDLQVRSLAALRALFARNGVPFVETAEGAVRVAASHAAGVALRFQEGGAA
ncbi:VOC family protein [Paraburkholderia acidisoli]|uniref:VOC family protein n=1 Tax=Paraburkholderia acidisoli TaxID=2571748 RepID=A0A7Z2JIS6_9BURK|nr:VOC family protein [Paraburkholderia acidisoli]QGZ65468.1 VOC family protein [Paraburkholderia acidisoli]